MDQRRIVREGGRAGPRTPLAGFWQSPSTLDAADPSIPNLPLLTGGVAPPVVDLAWMLPPDWRDEEDDDALEFTTFLVPEEAAAEVDLAWMLAPDGQDSEDDEDVDPLVFIVHVEAVTPAGFVGLLDFAGYPVGVGEAVVADLAWMLAPEWVEVEVDDELDGAALLVSDGDLAWLLAPDEQDSEDYEEGELLRFIVPIEVALSAGFVGLLDFTGYSVGVGEAVAVAELPPYVQFLVNVGRLGARG